MSDDELRLSDPDRFANTDDLEEDEITPEDEDDVEKDEDYLAVADLMASSTPEEDDRPPESLIYMTNPDLPGDEVAQATVESYRTLWQPRGWIEVDAPSEDRPFTTVDTGTTPETTSDSDNEE